MKTWRHPQNRKYITYRNASRGEPSQGHMQHAQIFGEVRPVVFELCKRTTKQTYSSQYFAPLPFYGAPCVFLSSDGTQMHDNQLYWITAHGGYDDTQHPRHRDGRIWNTCFYPPLSRFIENFSFNLLVKEFLKSVNIWRSNKQNGWSCHTPHWPQTFVLKDAELAR